MIGFMTIGEMEEKQLLDLKRLMTLKLILLLLTFITTLKTLFLQDGCIN